MSLSCQVLASPFDVLQRPRTASKQVGRAKGVHFQQSFRSKDCDASEKTNAESNNFHFPGINLQGPDSGCVIFDSRLMTGDMFANPIVKVQRRPQQQEAPNPDDAAPPCSRSSLSTPPPVKGRHHASVQTDSMPSMLPSRTRPNHNCSSDMIDTEIERPSIILASRAQIDIEGYPELEDEKC